MNQFSYRRMNRIFSTWRVKRRFQSAKKRGDFRYLAVRDYASIPLPKHLEHLQRPILTCVNYRILRGTTDALRIPYQIAYQVNARRYAIQYNAEVYKPLGAAKPEGFVSRWRWFPPCRP